MALIIQELLNYQERHEVNSSRKSPGVLYASTHVFTIKESVLAKDNTKGAFNGISGAKEFFKRKTKKNKHHY